MSKQPSESQEQEQKVGGISFFLSLITITFLSIILLTILPQILSQTKEIQRWRWFGGGVAVGAAIAHFCIRGGLATFIHEVKHSIISGLVGNKWRAMEVNNEEGHFKYAYSKRSAHYHAFISLAPYWLPLFTFAAFLVGYTALYPNLHLIIGIVGIAYGADSILNFRDISPIQTDLTNIRGGYNVARFYIISINIFVISLILIWVSNDLTGLREAGKLFWKLVTSLVGLK